jgi:IS30 family transposase
MSLCMLVKVVNKDAENVVSGLVKSAKKLPSELYKSLTWDRGNELAAHSRLTMALMSMSTSAILNPHGNADQMKTLTDC